MHSAYYKLVLLIACLTMTTGRLTFAASTPTDSTGLQPPSVTPACAKSYTAYLSSGMIFWNSSPINAGSYNDPTYSGHPPAAVYSSGIMPQAGMPVPPSGLPLCSGTYQVTVALYYVLGPCGNNKCNIWFRLYAGTNPSTILASDVGLGKDYAAGSYQNPVIVLAPQWKTSEGPIYPPLFRGGGSDYLYLLPGPQFSSYIQVQWVGP